MKNIATTLAALMLAAMSVGIAQPAAAAPYFPMHPTFPFVVHHPKHPHSTWSAVYTGVTPPGGRCASGCPTITREHTPNPTAP